MGLLLLRRTGVRPTWFNAKDGTRGRNALTDGDPGTSLGTGSGMPPGNWRVGYVESLPVSSQGAAFLLAQISPPEAPGLIVRASGGDI